MNEFVLQFLPFQWELFKKKILFLEFNPLEKGHSFYLFDGKWMSYTFELLEINHLIQNDPFLETLLTIPQSVKSSSKLFPQINSENT